MTRNSHVPPNRPGRPAGPTRRAVLEAGVAVGAVAVAGPVAAYAASELPEDSMTQHSPMTLQAPVMRQVEISINGEPRSLSVDSRTTLLDTLREHLGLTGTKKGCDQGQCGACTVLLERHARSISCLTFAVMHDGDAITTIEGLGEPGNLHAMQAAFIEHDGFQCGYCTPGPDLLGGRHAERSTRRAGRAMPRRTRASRSPCSAMPRSASA